MVLPGIAGQIDTLAITQAFASSALASSAFPASAFAPSLSIGDLYLRQQCQLKPRKKKETV